MKNTRGKIQFFLIHWIPVNYNTNDLMKVLYT